MKRLKLARTLILTFALCWVAGLVAAQEFENRVRDPLLR